MTALFQPFKLKDLTLRNRIAIPPMCQYSATDGVVNDWHRVHYPALDARGGAGLLIVEATAVSPEGRITRLPRPVERRTGRRAGPIAASIKAAGAVPGIQIGHAGRKASANRPWEGDDHRSRRCARLGDPVAHGHGLRRPPAQGAARDDGGRHRPRARGLHRRREAARPASSGWSCTSPTATRPVLLLGPRQPAQRRLRRQFENRSRFRRDRARCARVAGEPAMLTVRFGVIEYDGRDERRWPSRSSSRNFKREGLDFLNVSVGFSTLKAKVPWGPAFPRPQWRRARAPGRAAGGRGLGIDNPAIADACVRDGQLDLVGGPRPPRQPVLADARRARPWASSADLVLPARTRTGWSATRGVTRADGGRPRAGSGGDPHGPNARVSAVQDLVQPAPARAEDAGSISRTRSMRGTKSM